MKYLYKCKSFLYLHMKLSCYHSPAGHMPLEIKADIPVSLDFLLSEFSVIGQGTDYDWDYSVSKCFFNMCLLEMLTNFLDNEE